MKFHLSLVLLLLTQAVAAQNFIRSQADFPLQGLTKGMVLFDDLDADGDQDIIVTGQKNDGEFLSMFYGNDGFGNYDPFNGLTIPHALNASVALADVNGDGFSDFLIAGRDKAGMVFTYLYLNQDGGGYQNTFSIPSFYASFDGVKNGAVAFGDVDQDGDPDIMITGQKANGDRIAKLYRMDSTGYAEDLNNVFEGVTNSEIAFADIDGDNDQDLLITGYNSATEKTANWYINDGTGQFTQQAASFAGLADAAIRFFDMDGDNDQDLLLTGLSDSGAVGTLLQNDGTGQFTPSQNPALIPVVNAAVSIADVDGDNDTDIIVAGMVSGGALMTNLYLNDGNGSYTKDNNAIFEGVFYSSVDFGDADGDGDEDIILFGENSSGEYIMKLYQNDGTASFSERVGQPFEGVLRSAIAFADIDGDNDQDALIAGSSFARGGGPRVSTHLYKNDGMGNFSLVENDPFADVQFGAIAFADIENDGDQDVLITGQSPTVGLIASLYTNDGTGTFTEVSNTPFDVIQYSTNTFADIDGDGDQDVIICGSVLGPGYKTSLYKNDGQGNFSIVPNTTFPGVRDASLDFADVDGDLDLDLLLVGRDITQVPHTILYLNDGVGNFSEALNTPFDTTGGTLGGKSSMFVDIDGDLDQDVFLSGIGSTFMSNLYLNDGAGGFTEKLPKPFPLGLDGKVGFGDFDQDNDLDLFMIGSASGYVPYNNMYLNDGAGDFSEIELNMTRYFSHGDLAFVDVDGDQDLDLMLSGAKFSSSDTSSSSSTSVRFTHLYLNEEPTNTSIREPEKQAIGFKVYPNPTDGHSIQLEYTAEQFDHFQINLFDQYGRLLMQEEHPFIQGPNRLALKLPSLAAGVYYIQLHNETHSVFQKIQIL